MMSEENKSFSIHAFIINLDKATDRMAHMRKEIERIAIPFTRIEAVYGPGLPQPIEEFNERKFNILTGKRKNLREVGCYLSHIKVFEELLQSEADYALVLEDDVRLPETLPELLVSSIRHREHWDLLRLSSSRAGKYIEIASLDEAHKLTYNLKVLKNTGAYLISRHGARICREKMVPMCLPYDVALDRDWDFGIKTACITPFPVQLEDFPTQIIHKAPRIRFFRATTFHLFHLLTRIQRKRARLRYAQDIGK